MCWIPQERKLREEKLRAEIEEKMQEQMKQEAAEKALKQEVTRLNTGSIQLSMDGFSTDLALYQFPIADL